MDTPGEEPNPGFDTPAPVVKHGARWETGAALLIIQTPSSREDLPLTLIAVVMRFAMINTKKIVEKTIVLDKLVRAFLYQSTNLGLDGPWNIREYQPLPAHTLTGVWESQDGFTLLRPLRPVVLPRPSV